jgi:voltage-gated potassium channel
MELKKSNAPNKEPDFGRLEFYLLGLIVCSLLAFSIETALDSDSALIPYLHLFEWVSVIIFTVEYIARVALTKPVGSYALSFMGLIDLLAILPFYLSGILDFRALRAVRLLKLFRALKLIRYIRALDRFRSAFNSIKEELLIAAATAGVVLFLAAVGIYYFEKDAQPEQFGSVFHSLWWATATLTTVGYGDVYPVTVGGKFFTFFILIIGLGLVAVPTALFATAMTNAKKSFKRPAKSKTKD